MGLVYSVRLAGSRLEQAAAIAVDDTGAVVITGQTNSPDFPLVNALQPAVPPGGDAADQGAFITKLDRLGRIMFSTGWGGRGVDAGTAVAVDRARDIYVTGTTSSPDFPTSAGAFQRALASSSCSGGTGLPCADVFITKFRADGQTTGYSTLFGGNNGETVRAVAVDGRGSVHFAGTTASPDLPLRRALQTSCDSVQQTYGCSEYIAKLNSSGASLEYATYFGSRGSYVFGLGQTVNSLAIDPDGNLVAAGTTRGNDLPLVRALQSVNSGGPLFKSTDDGVSWTPSSDGITGTGIWFLAAGGRASQTLYASTFNGTFRSEDQGRRWTGRRAGANDPTPGLQVAVDPLTPSTLYAVDVRDGCLKSSDGGETWTRLPLEQRALSHIAVAPSSPSNIYVSSRRGVFHSPNGGITWSLALDVNPAEDQARPGAVLVEVDRQNADIVYVALSDGTIRRRDAQQWNPVAPLTCPVNQLLFASAPPPTIYALACGNVWKSADDTRSCDPDEFRPAGRRNRAGCFCSK